MNCCVKCFMSSEIKSIIKNLGHLGNCSFCESNNVHKYDLHSDNGLDDLFNDILSKYKVGSDLIVDGFSQYKLISIKDEFGKKWNIFNDFDGSKIHLFLNSLLERNHPDKLHFLNNQVGIEAS